MVKPTWVGQDIDSWGIDHGTWSVLLHAFPDASIPVVQLSLNAFKDFDHHLELGRKLAALRDNGVLVIGSGNIVHNLRAVDYRQPDTGYDWATASTTPAKKILLDRTRPRLRPRRRPRLRAAPFPPPTTSCHCSTSLASPATPTSPLSLLSTGTPPVRSAWPPTRSEQAAHGTTASIRLHLCPNPCRPIKPTSETLPSCLRRIPDHRISSREASQVGVLTSAGVAAGRSSRRSWGSYWPWSRRNGGYLSCKKAT